VESLDCCGADRSGSALAHRFDLPDDAQAQPVSQVPWPALSSHYRQGLGAVPTKIKSKPNAPTHPKCSGTSRPRNAKRPSAKSIRFLAANRTTIIHLDQRSQVWICKTEGGTPEGTLSCRVPCSLIRAKQSDQSFAGAGHSNGESSTASQRPAPAGDSNRYGALNLEKPEIAYSV